MATETPSRFQDYQVLLHPTWLRGQVGRAWGASLGAVKDLLVQNTQLAAKCAIIGTPTQVPFGPDDSLALNGADRGMDRGQNETSAAYAARVLNAWNVWPFAGTAFGLLRAFFDAGYPNVVVANQLGRWYTIVFDIDGNLALGVGVNQWRWTFDANSPCIPVAQGQIKAWAAGTQAPGAAIVPSPSNGFWYETSKGGVAAAPQPTWPKVVGKRVTDGGGVVWQCKGRDLWSRFGVFFIQPIPSVWAGVPPGDSSPEVQKFRKLITKWKSGMGTCVAMAALLGDGSTANSGQTWDYRPAGATWDNQGRTSWDADTSIFTWTPPSN